MAVASSGMQEVPEISVVRVSEKELYEYLNRAGLNIDVGAISFMEQDPERVSYQSASGNADTSTSATGGTGNPMQFGDDGIENIVETLKYGIFTIDVNIPKIMDNADKKGTREEGAEEGVEPQELS